MKQLEREIRICGQGWSSGHRLRQVDHRQQVLEEVLATVVVVIGVDDDDWWRVCECCHCLEHSSTPALSHTTPGRNSFSKATLFSVRPVQQ